MKQQASRKIMRTLLATAVGALLPAGAAYAVDILGNHIDDPTPGAMTPRFDATKYDHIDVLGNITWAPKAGAEGPMRMETMGQPTGYAAPQTQGYEKLDILGNVFWLPQKP